MTTIRSIAQSLLQSKPAEPSKHTADFFSGPVLSGHHATFHLNLHYKSGNETYHMSIVKKGSTDVTIWEDPYPYRREYKNGSRFPGNFGYNSGFTVDEPGDYEVVIKRSGRVQTRFPFTAEVPDLYNHPSIRFESDAGVSFLTFAELSTLLGKGNEYAIAFASTVMSAYDYTVREGLYNPVSGTYTCINRSFLTDQMQIACE